MAGRDPEVEGQAGKLTCLVIGANENKTPSRDPGMSLLKAQIASQNLAVSVVETVRSTRKDSVSASNVNN